MATNDLLSREAFAPSYGAAAVASVALLLASHCVTILIVFLENACG
jgi:hypothetical protein